MTSPTPPPSATDPDNTSMMPAVPPTPTQATPSPARQTPAPLTISIRLRPLETLRAVPRAATWIGLALCALGAIALLVAWRQVAGLTDVGLQMPYLISGGLISVCLMVVGLLLVAIDAMAVESTRRREQLMELRHMVALLADAPKDQA